MNVYQRISAVMREVEYLAKDDEVSTGKSSYKAITEEKVTSTVRAAMIKHGIVIIPVEQIHSRADETVRAYDRYNKCEVDTINRITTVETKYRIQNIDEPEDYIIAVSSGTGVDTQDKGVGKAMTYAFKYLLLRTFAIPTGEDPDKISSDCYTDKLMGAKKPKFEVNVYDDPVNNMRSRVKELVPDHRLREAACINRFKKKFLELDEGELTQILSSLNAQAMQGVTVGDTA